VAQVIITDQQVISSSWRQWGRTIAFGAVTGLIFWLITILVQRYAVEPVACQNIVSAATCFNAAPLSGNIAAIITAVAAIFFMVRSQIARPIVLGVASAALLWDMALWTSGLYWLEAVAWSIGLYAATYALLAWITRYANVWVTLSVTLLIVIIIRIAIVL
jgi:hypothetical protein